MRMSAGFAGSSCFITSGIRGTWGAEEVSAFLSSLAGTGHVSASTQNQAFSALLFLNGEVLGRPLGRLDTLVRA